MIYGKRGHAEVNGLVAQTNDEALIIEQEEDLKSIDFSPSGNPVFPNNQEFGWFQACRGVGEGECEGLRGSKRYNLP